MLLVILQDVGRRPVAKRIWLRWYKVDESVLSFFLLAFQRDCMHSCFSVLLGSSLLIARAARQHSCKNNVIPTAILSLGDQIGFVRSRRKTGSSIKSIVSLFDWVVVLSTPVGIRSPAIAINLGASDRCTCVWAGTASLASPATLLPFAQLNS